MKKKVILIVLTMVAMVFFLSACGSSLNGGDERLHGSWDWNGSVFYQFNEDGTGSMFGSDIRWGVNGGRLEVCVTPATCRSRCSAPISSAFSLTDNDNTLNFNGYTYTRR